MADDTRLQVDIESIRKDIENINSIHTRLDTAIDRLTDVSTSIKSMLAVHEEKITRQEEAIFQRFYSQRPPGETFGQHSGLGLSICRQIVEAHGGTITAGRRAELDGGARFTVRLPMP